MNVHGKDIKVFTGNAHPALAEEIADKLGLPVGQAVVDRFSDGEIQVNIRETVRGSDVFLVQPTCPPANENIIEMLIMIDAFKRASAARITAVIPYFGYARQDRKSRARDPISAKLMANLITTAGADRVLTMDLHVPQIQGFFDIPLDHLMGLPVFVDYYKGKFNGSDDVIVVSPDTGSVERARKFADTLTVPLAIIDKRRPRANVSEVMNVIGDINGKTVILMDDIIDTGGSLVSAADVLLQKGATDVYACCTHGVLSGNAVKKIKDSSIKELVILNTIPLPEQKRIHNIKILSVGSIFAEAIERIYEDISVSMLFMY